MSVDLLTNRLPLLSVS